MAAGARRLRARGSRLPLRCVRRGGLRSRVERGTLHPVGDPAARIIHGDARRAVPRLRANSVHAVVTDPPFEMRRPGGRKGGYLRQAWDRTGIAFDVAFWRSIVRVMRPGAHLVSFGFEKTIHRLAVALEDAGLEVRHLGMWIDANRMPWSRDVVAAGAGIAWAGWGTALKAATPWILCRKPLGSGLTLVENLRRWGTGALHIDAARHPAAREGADGRWPSVVLCSDADMAGPALGVEILGPGLTSDHGRRAAEPRMLRRRGMGYRSTAAGNATMISGDAAADLGGVLGAYARFHRIPDCADLTLAIVPPEIMSALAPTMIACPRANGRERREAAHGADLSGMPMKPVALMRHLVRLVSPPGGIVLDPFAGLGSTGVAAIWEGMRFIGVEQSDTEALPLVRIARARLAHARRTPPPPLVARAGETRKRGRAAARDLRAGAGAP